MQGWIKLHRCLMDKAIWQESTPEQKTVLITILMLANHKGNEWEWKGERFKAEAGQFVTSLPKIAEKCGKGITVQNVRTALKRFEKYGFLTDESTNKNRLITVVNWASYQGFDSDDNNQTNRQLTGDQQVTNRQLTSNKNVKNDKNEKEKTYTVQFDEWWSLYPKKNDKKAAYDKFKLKLKKHDYQTLLDGLKGYLKQIELDDTPKQYIKNGATFLNKESYLDFIGSNDEKPVKKEQSFLQKKLMLQDQLNLGIEYYRDVQGDEQEYYRIEQEYEELLKHG